jgi:hypothetical protein
MPTLPRHRRPRAAALAAALMLPAALPAAEVDIDLLSATQARNVVQVPNNATADRFSLKDVLGTGAQPGVRATVVFEGLRPHHQWRLLAAPLTIDGTGTLAQATRFQGSTFQPGAVQASYRFDSYRVTYRFALASSAHWQWHWGVTGKIRDAQIRLAQPGVSQSKQNTGFVPLLHLAGEADVGGWRVALDADGLASPQGRAFDLGARIGYAISRDGVIFAGVRMVEGGADNDEVYNFAQINQLSLGLRWAF